MMYFSDSATPVGNHAGFIEHEELELSEVELSRIKARARKAVTMDAAGKVSAPAPREYTQDFLQQAQPVQYADWLKGKQ